MSLALAWRLQRSPNILLISGTLSVEHLTENGANGVSDPAGPRGKQRASAGGERVSMLLAFPHQSPSFLDSYFTVDLRILGLPDLSSPSRTVRVALAV
jgi:hypothetical protein